MENEFLKIVLETGQEILTPINASIKIIQLFAPNESEHVKERIRRVLDSATENMHDQLNQDQTLRNDWFPENQVFNKRVVYSLTDRIIRIISNDSEERKSRYIAKFWSNMFLTSNSDIDEATAFSYLETIESLSWRQLCIIRLIILKEKKKIDINSIEVEKAEKMPEDQRTKFHSISRDYEELLNSRYITGVSVPRGDFDDKWSNEPYLSNASFGSSTYLSKRLHDLMNLSEIPDQDIVDTFSLWSVRFKQG